jgi:hypothetical protein
MRQVKKKSRPSKKLSRTGSFSSTYGTPAPNLVKTGNRSRLNTYPEETTTRRRRGNGQIWTYWKKFDTYIAAKQYTQQYLKNMKSQGSKRGKGRSVWWCMCSDCKIIQSTDEHSNEFFKIRLVMEGHEEGCASASGICTNQPDDVQRELLCLFGVNNFDSCDDVSQNPAPPVPSYTEGIAPVPFVLPSSQESHSNVSQHGLTSTAASNVVVADGTKSGTIPVFGSGLGRELEPSLQQYSLQVPHVNPDSAHARCTPVIDALNQIHEYCSDSCDIAISNDASSIFSSLYDDTTANVGTTTVNTTAGIETGQGQLSVQGYVTNQEVSSQISESSVYTTNQSRNFDDLYQDFNQYYNDFSDPRLMKMHDSITAQAQAQIQAQTYTQSMPIQAQAHVYTQNMPYYLDCTECDTMTHSNDAYREVSTSSRLSDMSNSTCTTAADETPNISPACFGKENLYNYDKVESMTGPSLKSLVTSDTEYTDYTDDDNHLNNSNLIEEFALI